MSYPPSKAPPVFLIAILAVVAASSFYLGYKLSPQQQFGTAGAKLISSPDAEDYFVSLIDSANESIDVEMYLFTNKRLATTLIAAKNRGVSVRIILERRIEGETSDDVIAMLRSAGVDMRYASMDFRLTHSKFLVIDKRVSAVGSHNWTSAAMTKNREASVQVEGPLFASQLSSLFDQDWSAGSAVSAGFDAYIYKEPMFISA